MCGIAGIVLKKKADTTILLSSLRNMSMILRHRGPDDEGIFLSDGIENQHIFGNDTPNEVVKNLNLLSLPTIEARMGLLHRRLAIQDLSESGHQPLSGTSSGCTLSFNGEIYNFKVLPVNDLGTYKEPKHWRSDIQALLSSWESYGANMLPYAEGMFAFAIYNATDELLHLVRDRTGVKPLYVVNTSEYFVFASEQKALLPFINKAKWSDLAIADYLINNKTEGKGGSFWPEIEEVPPGSHWIYQLKTHSLSKKKWFVPELPNDYLKYDTITFKETKEKVDQLLQSSVKSRLIAAVPVGTCLSGGIDSSLLTAFVKAEHIKSNNQELHSFSAAFKGFELDESHYAEEVSNHLGTKSHFTEPDTNYFLNHLKEVIKAQDIPFFGASTVAQFSVFSLPQKFGIKVTLDGQGADELFSGYPHHLGFWLRNALLSGRFDAWKKVSIADKRKLRMVLDHPIKNFDNHIYNISNKTLQNIAKEVREPLPNTLEECLWNEYYGTGLKVLLRTGDRNSMAHSVESRVPFADSSELAQIALKLSSDFKIRNGITKILLRAIGENKIPKSILERNDKIGFAAPENVWLKALIPQIKDQLKQSPINEYLRLNNWDKKLTKMLNQNKSPQVWKIINLWAWMELNK